MANSPREPVRNDALYNLRDAAGLTQQELADRLNQLPLAAQKHVRIDNVTISRWERGIIARPSAVHRRLLAEVFNVSLDELGFTRPRPMVGSQGPPSELDLDAFLASHSPVSTEPRVRADQDQWRKTRDLLNAQRIPLARVAMRLYEPEARLKGTTLLARPEWVLPQPVDLDRVEVVQDSDAPAPAITGMERQSRPVRPLATAANRYPRYSYALRELDHPGLFENRLSYRLLQAEPTGEGCRLTFTHTTYFDAIDVCEAAAHEMALTHLAESENGVTIRRPSWQALPFRRLIGDPFDPARRAVLPSINTLTLRRSRQGTSFVLHDRCAKRVAVAGDMLHVMPAGVFQPSSVWPAAQDSDFALWRNIMREYSEEFLGSPEHDGDGPPIDYTASPFTAMEHARASGGLKVWFLGLGVDPLTLFGEILTVVAVDAEVYDELFADMVDVNDEGMVVRVGDNTAPTTAIPFDQLTVPKLIEHHALAPAASACLHLAWQHRHVLLGD